MNQDLFERIYRKLLLEAGEESQNIPIPLKKKIASGEELSQKISSRLATAKMSKFALCRVVDNPGEKFFILYRAKETIDHFIDFFSKNFSASAQDVEEEIKKFANDAVIGMIQLGATDSYDEGPCNDALTVNLSATKDGYGPLLYDIAMSLSGGRPIMSDRKAVSTLAASLYKGFLRRKDIDKTRLVDKDDPANKDDPKRCMLWSNTWPDRDFLDYTYKRSTSLDAAEFEENHESVVSTLKSIFKSATNIKNFDVDNRIKYYYGEAGYDYFDKVYSNLSPKQRAHKMAYPQHSTEYSFRESVEKKVYKKLLGRARK